MNKRFVFVVGTVLGLVVLSKTPLLNALLAFFILGIIPGTDLALPAWLIIILYPILIVGFLYWLRTQPYFIPKSEPVTTSAKTTRPTTKKRLATYTKRTAPKRRPRTAV